MVLSAYGERRFVEKFCINLQCIAVKSLIFCGYYLELFLFHIHKLKIFHKYCVHQRNNSDVGKVR